MIKYFDNEWGQFIDIEKIIDNESTLNNYEKIIKEQIVINKKKYSKQNIFIKYFNEIISFIATLRYF